MATLETVLPKRSDAELTEMFNLLIKRGKEMFGVEYSLTLEENENVESDLIDTERGYERADLQCREPGVTTKDKGKKIDIVRNTYESIGIGVTEDEISFIIKLMRSHGHLHHDSSDDEEGEEADNSEDGNLEYWGFFEEEASFEEGAALGGA